MIYKVKSLPEDCLQVLRMILELREKLRFATSDALNRWTGLLARTSYARAIMGSNTIEGINVTLDQAMAAVNREPPEKTSDEDWQAIWGYREAMDYIIQLSKEPQSYNHNLGTLLSLHYMMMKYDLSKNPGRLRPGTIHITNTGTNQIVYEGPPAEALPALLDELIASLNENSELPVIARAAMAHLNLTMIHPFKDGNGRMARALQTMVLALEGILAPEFSSIEEYVGRNPQDYYAVLAQVGQGAWRPENDPLPWIRFCLIAHYRQAQTLLRRYSETSRLWHALEDIAKKHRLNERVVNALADAAIGLQVKNPTYRKQGDISDQVARNDLVRLSELGYLTPKGERRGRVYVASKSLLQIHQQSLLPQESLDPFEELEDREKSKQLKLPGMGR
ncbi:MAG: Fic family protein [Betaproteobacteria bacterium]|nr:Fic family protein [Betaproteobacteria bacterium]